ncbi:GNAT family N-acetyltransferase [Bizionia myxarmorum]|uniref:N-acetyltransferase n=1 Tax=Bizionia myxarmorum TaxID=291186 RepID=A0A5D0R6A4_9FLAO|nr:GNAT family N-acetyltransferase [Bizionia myxarmorum]TYB76391.1 N-acetyltransferase [Bizionia myxarmorum]
MEVKHKKENKSGTFYIEIDGKQEAEMTYEFVDDAIIDINHTEVNESLKGQGVGYKLVDAAVAFMRENNLKAVASCPYVEHVFSKKQDDYKDVIAN